MADDKNIIDAAVLLLAKSGIRPILKAGKIHFKTTESHGGPWVYLKYSNHNCTMLRTFIYEHVSKRLPKDKQFIPSECHSCYKVVARPESLTDLLALKDIMKEMGYPSKCGIERRESVDALYGGYWYCENYQEGLERLNQVKLALSQTKIPYFLKRGCTEFEQTFGPSDQWEITDYQKIIEKEIFERVSIDNSKTAQTTDNISGIMKVWDEWAEELGPVYIGSHNYVTYGGGGNGKSKHTKRKKKSA